MKNKVIAWNKLRPNQIVYNGSRKLRVCGIFRNYAICQLCDFNMKKPFVIKSTTRLTKRPEIRFDSKVPDYHFGGLA